MSFATCKVCFLRNAEPSYIADYLLSLAPLHDLSAHAQRCIVYKDGSYISIMDYQPDAETLLAADYDDLDNLSFNQRLDATLRQMFS